MKIGHKSRIMYTFYFTVPCQEAGNTVPGQMMDPSLFLSAAETQNLANESN
jgi:hypothetical protein